MDYTSAVEFLRDLKNNTYHFNIRQRMKMLLVVIGEHYMAGSSFWRRKYSKALFIKKYIQFLVLENLKTKKNF